MAAPGRTAPEGSRTVPMTLPDSVWPKASAGKTRMPSTRVNGRAATLMASPRLRAQPTLRASAWNSAYGRPHPSPSPEGREGLVGAEGSVPAERVIRRLSLKTELTN